MILRANTPGQPTTVIRLFNSDNVIVNVQKCGKYYPGARAERVNDNAARPVHSMSVVFETAMGFY